MEYEVIEKNEYGVLVKNTTDNGDCQFCKYKKQNLYISVCMKRHECTDDSYYLTDSEAAKLETELTPETFTINDLYVESKLLFDCQDKLNDLQIENDQLKERIKELESDKSTEIESKYLSDYNTTIHSCKKCNTEILRTSYNFCPNCGRKIIR